MALRPRLSTGLPLRLSGESAGFSTSTKHECCEDAAQLRRIRNGLPLVFSRNDDYFRAREGMYSCIGRKLHEIFMLFSQMQHVLRAVYCVFSASRGSSIS